MTRFRTMTALAAAAIALAICPAPASAQTKILRFPDIHGDKVVFCHGGDLWSAPARGGTATRLTAHPGQEIFPKFSHDGRWIAFTGQYDGDEQVYVIPAEGGVPKQLTWYPARGPLTPRWGYDNQVFGWSPDDKSVIIRSLQDYWDLGDCRLYTVALDGGLPQALPMPYAGSGAFSPDGKRIVYSPLFRDFRTWKRYQGGWAQDLWIFDIASGKAAKITDDPRTDRDPMWIRDTIYFASDRSGTLNLFSYDPATKATKQLTQSTEWDVRWPSADGVGRIVFETDGELQVFDVAAGQATPISISVPDDGLAMRPSRVSASKQIEDFELGPKGKRALFVARGDVFTVPAEKGPTRNLTNTSNAHERGARWSPDGKTIAYLSDASGEEELYTIAQDGSGEPERITTGGKGMRFAPRWSPDGKRIAFSDKEGVVYVATIEGKKLVRAADEAQGQVFDYNWSPDGAFLAVSLSDPNNFRSIWIWSAADGQLRRVTGELWNESEPVWDPEGNYLFYLSDREFAPQISGVEFNYATDRSTGIYALALRKDVKPPFPPESDEVAADGEGDDDKKDAEGKDSDGKDEEKGDKGKKAAKKAPKPVRIDWEGLSERVARVPVEADDYASLSATKGHLIYVRGVPFFYGREAGRPAALQIFAMEDRKETTLAEKVSGYALSPDGSKVLVQQDTDYNMYDATPKGKDSKKAVSTKGFFVDRVPKEEWAQIFDEVWRRYRDFFYVENMHGYDWEALGKRYRELLPHVSHRSDLNYVIGEMISELNVSHAYIAGGDFEIPDRPKVALPGARFELDKGAGRYRISRILRGQNEETGYRSPLTEIGVDARVGDYLIAIDGEEVAANDNPYRHLRNKSDRPVELTLNDSPNAKGARKVTFNPITSEADLLYLEWVTKNREKVAKLTDGKAGYLHIPDMGADGLREFIKHFYGQVRKEGLVIDVRGNGGGNVSQMLIERLRRTLLRYRFVRTYDRALTYPSVVFNGQLVCLLSETSASDGDIFPAMFKASGLGPLIGMRSWGGVIGITNYGPLIDGGSVNVPQFGSNGMQGEWIIEGHGVDPDIIVPNDVESLLSGRDPQLERGVEELMKKVREDPRPFPPRPADPVRVK